MDTIRKAIGSTLVVVAVGCGAFWLAFFVTAFIQVMWRLILICFLCFLALCIWEDYGPKLRQAFRRKFYTRYSEMRALVAH